jgi:hypothetical protein
MNPLDAALRVAVVTARHAIETTLQGYVAVGVAL